MCYEFDEMYRKAREAEEARRKKLADDLRQPNTSSPAKPAAPPPTMTTLGGRAAAFCVAGPASGSLSRAKTLPSTCSTRHRGNGSNAGARKARPLRRLKQAWCQGHRIEPPTTSPSANGP